MAAARGITRFATTLTVSPYQRHDLIRRTGEAAAAAHGVEFLYADLRAQFARSGQESSSPGPVQAALLRLRTQQVGGLGRAEQPPAAGGLTAMEVSELDYELPPELIAQSPDGTA